jgi:hypothetical protein
MDKAVLRNFAIESRKDLMEKIDRKIKLFYVDEEFKKDNRGDVIVLSNDKHTLTLTKEEDTNRDKLLRRIVELGYEQVVEEAAYTWFNRIIAIRYMEINDYLPLTHENKSLGIKVLSSNDNLPNPEILKFSNLNNTELDLNFNKDIYNNLGLDDLRFKYVLKLVCRKLSSVIPQVFGGTVDYIDLLVPDNMLLENGFVSKLIKEIPTEDFRQVEIIGWLYQYYNQTEKDRVISSKKSYKKNEIPYATELFTPDWIVKYMVENSLGKYWLEHGGNDELKEKWKYYSGSTIKLENKKNIEELKFIDPCCGSGHILVYAFEVLYQIYESEGFNKKDIAENILKNNIYGLDIDDRAGQLSILSIILKAREYDSNIFSKDIISNLNVISIQESYGVDEFTIDSLPSDLKQDVILLKDTYKDGKEIGSLMVVEPKNFTKVREYINNVNDLITLNLRNVLPQLIKQNDILSRKYDVVVTNPPYLSQSNMSVNLKEYISKHYADSKADLFSAFITRNCNLCNENGYLGFLTPFVWMFISSYEKLREKILSNCTITNIVQLEYNSFEAACVPVVAFTLKNRHESDYVGSYVRLSDFPGANIQEKKYLEAINEHPYFYYETSLENMESIPKKPIAYWLSKDFLSNFSCNKVSDYANVVTGMTTADNNRFLRKWWEVSNLKIGFGCEDTNNKYKWYPYQKGGDFRKWYGNNEYVVNWENNGYEIKNFKDEVTGKVRSSSYNDNYILHEGLSWTYLSNSCFGIRYVPKGFLFDNKGSMVFCKEKLYYILGFMCTKYAHKILDLLNPTMSFQPGDIASVPIKMISDTREIDKLVIENINIEKEEWDFYETSMDFKKLNYIKKGSIKDLIAKQMEYEHSKFDSLKSNEELLNSKYNEIYNIAHEIDSKIENKDITYRISDDKDNIKRLISYSVGCMFGRYSLDEDGLMFAGGNLNKSKYCRFEIDEDDIIPISDKADIYYNDDIVGKFVDFIRKSFGEEHLKENLNYIAEVLGKKGIESSEDTIRRYFTNEFYNDHLKIYQKRPIYWLFDSGKKNGFKCLVYLHRYNEQIVSKIRTKYLHNTISVYQRILDEIDYKLNNEELNTTDKRELQSKKVDLNGKIMECNEYDEKIGNVANKMIKLDLDDGVVVNYAKFVDDNGKSVLATIK